MDEIEKRGNSSVLQLAVISAAIVIILAIIAWPLCTGKIYASYDLREMAIPDRVHFAVSLERGEKGHWQPFFWRGIDRAAYGETGMFHPIRRALYRFIPLPYSIIVELMLHFPVSLLGAFLFFRRSRKLSSVASLSAAALFAFSIFPMAHFGQTHMCFIFSHLPWMAMFAAAAMAGRRPWVTSALTGLCLASVLLLCHPHTAFLVCIPVGLLILHRICIAESKRLAIQRSLLLALGLVGGLLIGMLQLVPTLAALAESQRGALSQVERNNFALHPLHLLTNLLPTLYGRFGLGDMVQFPGKSPQFVTNTSEFGVYFGIGLITLLWAGAISSRERIFNRRNRCALVIASVAAGITTLLMLGAHGGLNRLLAYAPLLSQFRSPNRYKIVLSALACVAAGSIIQSMQQTTSRRLSGRDVYFLFLPAGASLMTGLIMLFASSFHFRDQVIEPNAGRALILGVGVATITALLYLWWDRRRQAWVPAAIVALCLVDVAIAGLPGILEVPYVTHQDVRQAAVKTREATGTYRVIANENFPIWRGEYLATGYLGMLPPKQMDFSQLRQLQLASVVKGYASTMVSREVPQPVFPRFRLVPVLTHAREEALSRFPSHAPGITALCHPSAAPELRGALLQDGEGLRVLRAGFGSTTIQLQVNEDRVLICSDRWAPGWVATSNGAAVPVFPVYDGAMQGVIVTPAMKEIRLTYSSPYVARGWWYARWGIGLMLALFAAAVGAALWRRRRNAESATEDTTD